jgi:hypothetical protein
MVTWVKPSPKEATMSARSLRRLAGVLLATGALLSCSGEADEPVSDPLAGDPAVPASAAAVLDFPGDSLCTWFTADDMNEMLATAQQRAGTAYDFQEFNSCPGMWKSGESSPGLTVWFGLEPLGGAGEARWSPFVEPNPDEFRGHSLLDDEVAYQTRTYQFAWKAGVDGYLQVVGHEDEILYFGLAVHTMEGKGTNEYEELGLAMVDEVLQGMNWINVTE